MKTKQKLKLMREVEKRNQARIDAFTAKPRKGAPSGFKKKAEGNRSNINKKK